MNIFIGSLPYSVKDSDLQGFFEEYGEVSSARVITDKFSGRSKGYGFVEMQDEAAAKKAIEELNGAELEGRTIVVNQAHERTENSGRERRSYNSQRGGNGQRRGGYNQNHENRRNENTEE
ncbi:MAG: RNA-binding protein [Bacteroidales bacterium]|jgi:RNA recognition motif-containing protein|nr:RNA-binding protein [Bacteroidales bacterium]MDY0314034.1 RNA-binding protein [Bacteroidales bacterium]NLB86658.1 RNA-binding protein [Bacteroidales bacterium]